MGWIQATGLVLFGVSPTFFSYWIEDMWPVGSWQWAALTFACLIFGVVLMNWDRWAMPVLKIRFVASDNAQQKSDSNTWFDWLWWATIIFGFVVLLGYCQAKLEKSIFGRQWSHTYLSEGEGQKAEDACAMKAYEAIGGGKFQRQHDRQDYIDACMESQGFVQQRAEQ